MTGHDDPASIDTARLSLRPLSVSDEALFCDLFTDAQTMQFIGPPLTRDRASRSFRKILDSMRRRPVERLFLTVLDPATGETIGICSVQRVDTSRRRADAGIMLKPGSRAHGLAKEAFAALVAQAFATFPIDEVRAQIAANHSAAERVLIGVGFCRSDDAGTGSESLARRTWSVYRESWSAPAGN